MENAKEQKKAEAMRQREARRAERERRRKEESPSGRQRFFRPVSRSKQGTETPLLQAFTNLSTSIFPQGSLYLSAQSKKAQEVSQ